MHPPPACAEQRLPQLRIGSRNATAPDGQPSRRRQAERNMVTANDLGISHQHIGHGKEPLRIAGTEGPALS
jgi:hypothetical protein